MPMTAHLLAGDVSKAVRDRYIKRIRNAQRKIGRLEDTGVKALVADLMRARRDVLIALTDATEFGAWNLPQVKAAIEEALAKYRTAGSNTLKSTLDDAWTLGVDRVSSLAADAGVGINVPSFKFGVPRDQLEFAQASSVDLIQAESDEVLKKVMREVRFSFAGGQTREQLIRRVHQNITKPLRFGTMRKRAEVIVRTEVNRVHNAAADASRKKLETENVKVRKQWIASGDGRTRSAHRQLNGVTVDVDKPFPYPGLPRSQWPQYPLDPVLPAHAAINCRCAVIELFDIVDEPEVEAATAQVEPTGKAAR